MINFQKINKKHIIYLVILFFLCDIFHDTIKITILPNSFNYQSTNTFLLLILPLCAIILSLFSPLIRSKKIVLRQITWCIRNSTKGIIIYLGTICFLIIKFIIFDSYWFGKEVFAKNSFLIVERFMNLNKFKNILDQKLNIFLINNKLSLDYKINESKKEELYNYWITLDQKFSNLDSVMNQFIKEQWSIDNRYYISILIDKFLDYCQSTPWIMTLWGNKGPLAALFAVGFVYRIVSTWWSGGITGVINYIYSYCFTTVVDVQGLAQNNRDMLIRQAENLNNLANLARQNREEDLQAWDQHLTAFYGHVSYVLAFQSETLEVLRNQLYENDLHKRLLQRAFEIISILTISSAQTINLTGDQITTIITVVNYLVDKSMGINRPLGAPVLYNGQDLTTMTGIPSINNILEQIQNDITTRRR